MESDLVTLLAQNQIALACAIFAFLVIRALRDDVKWFFTLPATLPVPFGGGARFESKQIKPWLAIVAAVLEATIEHVKLGKSWGEAAKGAFIVAALPVLLRELGLKIENPKAVAGGAAIALIGLMGLSTVGCAVSFEESRLLGLKTAAPMTKAAASDRSTAQDAYCRELDNDRIKFGGIAKGAGLLAGGAGGGTSIYAVLKENDSSRVVLLTGGITTAVAAAVAGYTLFTSEGKAAAWARDCSMP